MTWPNLMLMISVLYAEVGFASLMESSTVLSFDSSPSLKAMKIDDRSMYQGKLGLTVEINNPLQEYGPKKEEGNIFISIMLSKGAVIQKTIHVTSNSSVTKSFCLNSLPDNGDQLKVVLISDLNAVKNITMKFGSSECAIVYKEHSTLNYFIAAIACLIVVIVILVAGICFCLQKQAKPKSRHSKNSEYVDVELQPLNQISTEAPIEAEIAIDVGSKNLDGNDSKRLANEEIKNCLKIAKLKFKTVRFRRYLEINKTVMIFNICVIDGDDSYEHDSFEKFKDFIQKRDAPQFSIYIDKLKKILTTTVKISIGKVDKLAAKNHIMNALNELDLCANAEFEKAFENSDKIPMQKYNVQIPDDKNVFDNLKETFISSDTLIIMLEFKIKVKVYSESKFEMTQSRDIIQNVMTNLKLEGTCINYNNNDETFQRKAFKYWRHKFNVEIFGDQATFVSFKQDLLKKTDKNNTFFLELCNF